MNTIVLTTPLAAGIRCARGASLSRERTAGTSGRGTVPWTVLGTGGNHILTTTHRKKKER